MKTLDRQQLDVVNTTRINIFGWCQCQFTPEFVARDFRKIVGRVFSVQSL